MNSLSQTHNKLKIDIPLLGILTEINNGNLDYMASQGSLVRILVDARGNKYVIKLANTEPGYRHLLLQIHKLQHLQENSINIFPKIIDFAVTKNQVYYIMLFVEAESGYKKLFQKGIADDVFTTRFKAHYLNPRPVRAGDEVIPVSFFDGVQYRYGIDPRLTLRVLL